MTSVRDELIFGCATVADQATRKESLRLLAQASDVGIVHFDTARAYGAGESEAILARHLSGRRDQMLVTTKYGLAPPVTSALLTRTYTRATAVRRMGPAVGALRRARRTLRGSLFSPARICANLEASLRALGTDYVDYFLLHEATVAQARRTVTLTLDQLVTEGKVREYGIGSAYARIEHGQASIPASYRVLQFEHSPLAPVDFAADLRSGRVIFTHSALSRMGRIAQLLAQHPGLVRKYSSACDVDPTRSDVLPGLLLAYSHTLNPTGKVIFSTRSSRRIVDNVEAFCEVRSWSSERLAALRCFFDELSAQPERA
jgi:diketogulonate reductase-like aldo/keto reductase